MKSEGTSFDRAARARNGPGLCQGDSLCPGIPKEVRDTHAKRVRSGFSLLEAVLAILVLSLIASIVSGMYFIGIQSLEVSAERTVLDGQLRSRMEELLSREFDSITDGTDTVTVQGQTYTVNWTVANTDLDGDSVAEGNAKQITVSLNGWTLQTIVVDNGDALGKI